MDTHLSSCRICKKVTMQRERIVTDTLPPNVKVLECLKCGVMGVVLLESNL
jgi:hypothetical protein